MPLSSISEDLKLSDPDAYYGMKDALCINAINHDASRQNAGSQCWSCRVPLSTEAAAAEGEFLVLHSGTTI
jgi:hypothetical protein